MGEIYCPTCQCGEKMKPIWFWEDEYKTAYSTMYKTGRKRRNVSHFECDNCGKKEACDDSFAGQWM